MDASLAQRPGLLPAILAILRLLASHCPRESLGIFGPLMTTARIGAAITSETNTTVGRGMAIDLLRIILAHDKIYAARPDIRATLLCSVMRTCIQVYIPIYIPFYAA